MFPEELLRIPKPIINKFTTTLGSVTNLHCHKEGLNYFPKNVNKQSNEGISSTQIFEKLIASNEGEVSHKYHKRLERVMVQKALNKVFNRNNVFLSRCQRNVLKMRR